MNLLRRRKGSYAAVGFLLPCCGMLLLMLICGYRPFGNRAMLYSDAYHQYYPFFLAFRRALLRGDSLLHSWDVGMGVDYLGMIAYYLGSPLNLLSVLVPEGQVLNFFCLLMPVRLGLAGMFFAILLRELYGRDNLAVGLFGAFYGLCAWALGYQWNVMWLDTFALLPLVMLGMVRLLRDKKVVLYTVTLFLSVFSNYYIGFFTCIFVFLVFFCYEICRFRGWKRFFADFVRIGIFSVLAIGMSAVLSLTAMAALQTTQSSVNKFPTSFRLNIASSHSLLGLLDGMRQVAGNMGGGLEPTFKEGLPNLYCGVGTILLGILFLISGEVKLRDKLCSVFLLLFFMVSFLIRQLDYIWHGFHFPNMIPYRFSFLFSFVLLYMAYRAWLVRSKFDRFQIFAAGLLTAAVFCCSNDFSSSQKAELFGQTVAFPVYIIYNAGFLVMYLGILLYGARRPKPQVEEEAVLLERRRIRRCRRRARNAVCVVMALELAATLTSFGCFFPGTAVSNYPKGTEEAASMIRYLHEREADNLFYRAETTHSQTLNDGALNGYSGISTFTSSANVHITEFMRALGYGAKNTYNRYCFEESSPVANLFLNLKYMIERDGKDKNSTFFREVHHFGNVALYQNNAYLPLGFLTQPGLAGVDFPGSDGGFDFQNNLFRATTGLEADVWHILGPETYEIYGTAATVSGENGRGYCTYSDVGTGANIIYSYVADRAGFVCVDLDLPKRNDVYISINGEELYRETTSLPQMMAARDVQAGDIIDIRITCKQGENGTATVQTAILDNDLMMLGQELLSRSVLELTEFSNTVVTGRIACHEEGLLYTSIPQNGNWKAYVDGAEADILLVGDCMIGVYLTEGEHTVRFVYHNAAFVLGAGISAVCTLVLVLLAVFVYRPGKGEKTETQEPTPEPEETMETFEQAEALPMPEKQE